MLRTYLEKNVKYFSTLYDLGANEKNKKIIIISILRNRDKPFRKQHITGLVNMVMSDTASGKHGSNKRGLQYKKAA